MLTDDGNIQGAALYYLNGMSYLEPDAGSVFADRLATAPRNRDWLVAEPACRGVGNCPAATAGRPQLRRRTRRKGQFAEFSEAANCRLLRKVRF